MTPSPGISSQPFFQPWVIYVLPILLALAAYYLQDLYLPSSLRSIPGPFFARFSRAWICWHVTQGNSHTLYERLHAEYGPIVRIGPKKVIVDDAKLLAGIYGTGDANLPKTEFYEAFQIPCVAAPLPGLANPRRDNAFSTRDGEYHKQVRTILTPAYSAITIKQLEPKVDDLVALLINQLSKGDDQVIDLGSWITAFAFDAAGLFTFHRPFGFLEAGKDTMGLIGDMHVAILYASIVGQVPWVHKLLLGNTWLLGLIDRFPSMREANAAMKVRKILWQATQEYHVAEGSRGDLLSFLKVVREKVPDRIEEEDVSGHLINNIFAGGDATAMAAQSILYDLIRHPSTLAKLRRELTTSAADQSSKPIRFAVANDFTYLKSIIKESLRLHPPFPMPLEREVLRDGLRIGRFYLPAGTAVGAAPSAVNTNSEAFGPDAGNFKPERWIEKSSDEIAQMERSLLSFGAGSRMCIGRNVAMFVLLKVIPEVVMRFDFEWAGDGSEWQQDGNCYFFADVKGLKVRIRLRRD